MTEPLLWLSLGALAVQAALFLSKDLQPIHFWVLTVAWNAAAVAAVSVRSNCIRLVSHSIAVNAVT